MFTLFSCNVKMLLISVKCQRISTRCWNSIIFSCHTFVIKVWPSIFLSLFSHTKMIGQGFLSDIIPSCCLTLSPCASRARLWSVTDQGLFCCGAWKMISKNKSVKSQKVALTHQKQQEGSVRGQPGGSEWDFGGGGGAVHVQLCLPVLCNMPER